MKTVTLPDQLVKKADRKAKSLGISRRELVTQALEHYLETSPNNAGEKMDEELKTNYDEVYSIESSKLEPGFMQAQIDTLTKSESTW